MSGLRPVLPFRATPPRSFQFSETTAPSGRTAPGVTRLVQLDDKICYCFHVSRRKILNYIRIHQPRRASQISECGGAGTGCGWCVPFLKKYFEQAQRGELELTDAITPEA